MYVCMYNIMYVLYVSMHVYVFIVLCLEDQRQKQHFISDIKFQVCCIKI